MSKEKQLKELIQHIHKELKIEMIPCNCLKGGTDIDGRTCERCKSIKWIYPDKEFNLEDVLMMIPKTISAPKSEETLMNTKEMGHKFRLFDKRIMEVIKCWEWQNPLHLQAPATISFLHTLLIK